MRLWWIETQDEGFLLVSHDVMISAFKFGGNRRFFGVDTTNYCVVQGWYAAIPVHRRIPVPCRIRCTVSLYHMAKRTFIRKYMLSLIHNCNFISLILSQ